MRAEQGCPPMTGPTDRHNQTRLPDEAVAMRLGSRTKQS